MRLIKRTIRLVRHNTSIALEPEFWAALEDCARRRGQSVPELIAEIDASRSGGLASAIRVAMLAAKARG